MRYKLDSGIIIRTENAAKPEKQLSSFLKNLILQLPPVLASVDYGCGKLRYTETILKTTDTLALVDSQIQITREQKLRGRLTTIKAVAQSSNRLNAYSTPEFGKLSLSFDRAFCINVVSVIPFLSVRKRVVELILNKLRPQSTCLFVVQYRNSDFSRMRKMRNAKAWRDGFLIDSLRGHSFYGLISPSKLMNLVTSTGFKVLDCRLNEGSVYLLAQSQLSSSRSKSYKIDEERNFHIDVR
jgi:hypothetical protein